MRSNNTGSSSSGSGSGKGKNAEKDEDDMFIFLDEVQQFLSTTVLFLTTPRRFFATAMTIRLKITDSQNQQWHIAPTITPVTKIPLTRVEPFVKRNLGEADSRILLEPAQTYVDPYPWTVRAEGGVFEEDMKLKVLF